MKKIILTGGGTAGHVIPNLALVPSLKAAGFEIHYIGSHEGIERGLVEAAGIPYYGISSGKLRRYRSMKNITDIFRVGKGLADALRVIRKIKPDLVFSKGGFVVVPVIAAAKLLRVKSVIHESDMTPGIATKLAIPFASKICVSFPETLAHVPQGRSLVTGSPIRRQLLKGSKEAGFRGTGLAQGGKPVVLVTGGSLGARAINNCVREALPGLLEHFQVVHLCGRGNLSGIKSQGYVEMEYVNEDMAHILAMCDVVVSRAGANTLFELAALEKPNVLIPLPAAQSRGDQLLNAASFEKRGFSKVLLEDVLTPETLVAEVKTLYSNRHQYIAAMSTQNTADGVGNVMAAIEGVMTALHNCNIPKA